MTCFGENIAIVDAPYTWRVPIASALANGLAFGFGKSAGLLVIGMKEEDFDLEPQTIMLTVSMNVCMMGLLSPLVNLLCQHLTARVVTCFGALVCVCALVLASCWLTPGSFVFFIGLMLSTGFALCFSPPLLLNGICFERYRSRAAGVCFAGESLGCTVMPFLFTILIDKYTVRGALLVLAAVFGNLIVPAVILPTTVFNAYTNQILDRQGLQCSSTRNQQIRADQSIERPLPTSKRRVRLFRNPCPAPVYALVSFTVAMMLMSFGYFNQVTVYPLLSNVNGISRNSLSWIIATHGLVEFFSRLGFGVIGEKLRAFYKLILLCSFLGLMAVFAQLISFLSGSLPFLVVYVVALGLSGGCLGALWTVIITILVGVSNSARGLSYILLVMSLFSLSLLYSMGYVHELIGSYTWVVRIGGISAFLALMIKLIIVAPAIRTVDDPTSPAEVRKDDEEKISMVEQVS